MRSQLTLRGKIRLFVGALIFISAISSVSTFYFLNTNQKELILSTDNIKPSVEYLEELKHTVTRSRLLISDLLKGFNVSEDKIELDKIHNVEYKELRGKLDGYSKEWPQNERLMLDSIFMDMDQLIANERFIKDDVLSGMSDLAVLVDDMLVGEAETTMEDDIVPISARLVSNISRLIEQKDHDYEDSKNRLIHSYEQMKYSSLLLTLATIVVSILLSIWLVYSLSKSLSLIMDQIVKLSKGVLPHVVEYEKNTDEISRMGLAVNELVANFKETAAVAEEIGKNNFTVDYKPLSREDILGNAIVKMKDNLEAFVENEAKIQWSTSGQASLGDLLNRHNQDIDDLSEHLLTEFCKIMNAMRGAIFIIDKDLHESPIMKLKSTYAWTPDATYSSVVRLTEGSVGECWNKGKIMYMDTIPDNYFTISSGLGSIKANTAILIPLAVSTQVVGIIELASLQYYQSHHFEFIEKVSNSIAIAIANLINNASAAYQLDNFKRKILNLEEKIQSLNSTVNSQNSEITRLVEDSLFESSVVRSLSNSIVHIITNNELEIQHITPIIRRWTGFPTEELMGERLAKLFEKQEDLSELVQFSNKSSFNTHYAKAKLKTKFNKSIEVNYGSFKTRDNLANTVYHVFMIILH